MHAEILDVTLRDGGYAINFQFSELDTKKIGVALENAGIKYVELAHGIGLGGNDKKGCQAMCSDEEYLAAAQEALKKCKYGAICVPAYSYCPEVKKLDMLEKYGCSFLRVASIPEKVPLSKPYIERGKEMGLMVSANFMKSYTATVEEFRKNVKLCKEYGVDCVYVVDSAGCMLPEDIKKYYDVIREFDGLKAGFHGHDNLGLAVANSLYAADLGFDIIDSSLQGLGRSAGNTSTELLASLLYVKYGIKDYDIKSIVKFGEDYVKPLVKNNGLYGLDIFCGIAGLHSSYMSYIHRVAAKYEVNPYELIVEYCKIDQINMDEDLLVEVAKKLPKDDINLSRFGFDRYIGNEQK